MCHVVEKKVNKYIFVCLNKLRFIYKNKENCLGVFLFFQK